MHMYVVCVLCSSVWWYVIFTCRYSWLLVVQLPLFQSICLWCYHYGAVHHHHPTRSNQNIPKHCNISHIYMSTLLHPRTYIRSHFLFTHYTRVSYIQQHGIQSCVVRFPLSLSDSCASRSLLMMVTCLQRINGSITSTQASTIISVDILLLLLIIISCWCTCVHRYYTWTAPMDSWSCTIYQTYQ